MVAREQRGHGRARRLQRRGERQHRPERNSDLLESVPTVLDAPHSPAVVPWTIGGNAVGTQYTPENGTGTGLMPLQAGTPGAGTYAQPPMFYISYLGTCSDGVGTCYQIDAVGYGGINPTGNSNATVAVVESTYEVQAGVNNLGANP